MAHLGRRTISIPVVIVALPLAIVTIPLWVPVTVLVDLLSGLFRLPTLRLGLFAVVYLAHSWAGLLAALVIWLLQLGGWRRHSTRSGLGPYRAVQAWWASSLLRWARRLLGIRFELPDPSGLPTEGFILMSRHASMVDAVLPVLVVADRLDRFMHYVLKRELRWDPNLDIYGHRLGNYFVERSGDGDVESAAIARFAQASLPHSVLVIFPEGTYATAANRARVRASIARTGPPELLALAHELDHLLPPKPAGSLSLLASRPDFDVVVLGHAGLEGVAELSGLRQRLPLSDPILVRWWVHVRTTLPTDPEQQIDWLNDQWRALDDWVGRVSIGLSREARPLELRPDPRDRG